MRRRRVLLALVLLGPLLAGPAAAVQRSPFDAGSQPFCPVCGEGALEEVTNATFERSTVEIRVAESGAGHWTVQNHVAVTSDVPSQNVLSEAVAGLVDDSHHLHDVRDVSVAVDDRTATVTFTDPEFAQPTAGDTLAVRYYVRDHHSYGPAIYNADEIAVRAPDGYRAVGPVGDGQERGVVRFDAAARETYDERGTRLVFARGSLAAVGGPLAYDLGRLGPELRSEEPVSLLWAAALLSAPMGFTFAATGIVGRRHVDRRPADPTAFGPYVAAGLACIATIVALDSRGWQSAEFFAGFAGLAALYGAVALGALVDVERPGLVSMGQFGVALAPFLGSLRFGVDGVVAAMVVAAGLASLGGTAAIDHGDWLAAVGYGAAASAAFAGSALLTFVFLEGLGAAVLLGIVIVVGPVAFVPAMLVGAVYGAPWREDGRVGVDRAVK